MYLRKYVEIFVFAILATACFAVAPSQASTRHHYHSRHTHLHHGVDTHNRYACHFSGCGRRMASAHPGHHGRTRFASFLRRHHEPSSFAVGIGDVHGQLEAKAQEIVSSCGSTIISAFRPGARIAGSGHISMHASGRAVDIKGNPHCIYSHLEGWPGGYSVDYGSVQHVHVSLGGFEDGVRFSHHGSHHRSS
jgi:hypothetical protein